VGTALSRAEAKRALSGMTFFTPAQCHVLDVHAFTYSRKYCVDYSLK
jgi:hypothetical protein